MVIRQLKQEEKFMAGRISGICFHERIDDLAKKRQEWEEAKEEDWGAFDEKGTLMARIINNRYTSYVDGQEIQNGGIGAVSTLPEYRNTGVVRNIFEKLLPYAYENGEVISTLYPFSHQFYRKFGYETVCYRNQYRFKPEALNGYRFDGEAVMWEEGEDISDYFSLYRQFAPKYNLAVKREEALMKREHMKGNIYKERKFSYLLREKGQNVAYLLIEDVYQKEAAFMWVEEAVWNSPEGFRAILGFLARFSADYGEIELTLPYDLELYSVIRSAKAYEIQKTTRQDYMVRVINVKRMLEILSKPEGTDCRIRVCDPQIEQNNRIWHVTENAVEVAADGTETDMEVSIQAFSQLAVGAISLDEALLREDIAIRAKKEKLRSLFRRKSIFINEHF